MRKSSQIIIETYTNKLWSEVVAEGDEMAASAKDKKSTTAMTEKRNREMPTSSSSRETTPLEGQCASELPKEIGFFSGNPSVEVTNGIIHLYKKK